MKIVFKSNDANEAYDICQLLENNGVPCQIQENDLKNKGSHIPNGVEVWIYVNEQYHDAVKLIDNPNHKVANALDIQQFYSTLSSTETTNAVNEQMLKFVKYGGFVIICVILAVFVIVKLKT